MCNPAELQKGCYAPLTRPRRHPPSSKGGPIPRAWGMGVGKPKHNVCPQYAQRYVFPLLSLLLPLWSARGLLLPGPSTRQARTTASARTQGNSLARGHGQGAEETHPGALFNLQLCCRGWDGWAPKAALRWNNDRLPAAVPTTGQRAAGRGAEARQVVAFIFATPGRTHYHPLQYDRANSAFLFRRGKKNPRGKETLALTA